MSLGWVNRTYIVGTLGVGENINRRNQVGGQWKGKSIKRDNPVLLKLLGIYKDDYT